MNDTRTRRLVALEHRRMDAQARARTSVIQFVRETHDVAEEMRRLGVPVSKSGTRRWLTGVLGALVISGLSSERVDPDRA